MRADPGKGGHYLFVVKENQPTLWEDVRDLWLEGAPAPDAVAVSTGHGRVEARRLWVSSALTGYTDWPHLAQACRLERTVTRQGRTTVEVAYAVTSLPSSLASPARLLALWRGHWGIENGLHWVRDVTFDEDRSQVRTRAGPQVMAALRNLAISLIRRAGHANIAAALRRHAAHPWEALALVGVTPLPS